MNAPVFTQYNLLFTVHSPLGENQLLFKPLQGKEQLSGLFYFQLELLSPNSSLDFNDILGQLLTVQIQRSAHLLRAILRNPFNFVSWLMEDVGLFHFFEHHEDRYVLVIINDMVDYQPCPEIDTARFWRNRNEMHRSITVCTPSVIVTILMNNL
ncbi:MAG: hypothetical protein HC877_13060 [Thioploca sp.]|nr:hypothetical protein [Thioploca sp.]